MLSILIPAMQDLVVGATDRLSADVGPLINDEARQTVAAHVARMRALGRRVAQGKIPTSLARGSFLAPAVIEIAGIEDLRREIFGPVLHVLRYAREDLDRILDALASTGYGLTCGVHSRIDATVARIASRGLAGNLYVNRNMIGAVVGVQPFGGHGLSGIGPKAGGPLYLRRLLAASPAWRPVAPPRPPAVADAWRNWLDARGDREARDLFDGFCTRSPLGEKRTLPGPDGELNLWELRPRGTVLCLASNPRRLIQAVSAALAVGNKVLLRPADAASLGRPPALGERLVCADDMETAAFDAILFEGCDDDLAKLAQKISAREGPLIPIHRIRHSEAIELEWLAREFTTSVNTAAAGGAVDLMNL